MSDQNPQIKIDLTNLNRIDDVKNGNIDVFVTLSEGFSISVLVGTSQNLQHLMGKDNVNFLSPPSLFIIVTKLTEEIIKDAINGYMEAGRSPDGELNRDNPTQEAEFYKARNEYFAKVPKKLTREFARKLLETGADPKATIEKGQMGIQKTPGSIVVIFSERKVVFRDKTGEIKTGAILSGTRQRGQWSNFLASGKDPRVYILFLGDRR